MVSTKARRTAKAGFLAGAAGAAFAAASVAAAWQRFARRPLPQTSGTIALDGLEGPVIVRRDRWGVPHVEAGPGDLWFAEGFCHGQDRLFQMDFYRRVASGRLSEVAGPETLPVDRLMLTFGVRRAALAEERALEPRILAPIERFCAGVNAAAAAARALPFEMRLLRQRSFEPWRPADVLSLGKLLAFALATNWESELMRADLTRALGPELAARLDPSYPAGNPIVTQESWSGRGIDLVEQVDAVRRAMGLATEASGSNNWAVSGARSATGSPLIAGDPHLAPSMPGIWYQVSLQLTGGRTVRGATLPGLPGCYMGQNDDVCWTFTNVMPDVQDLFVERIEGERYLFEGEWRPLETRREEIPVRGHTHPELLEVRSTHHGPIVNGPLGADEAEPLALSWLALDEPTAFAGMLDLHEVRSGAELVELLAGHTAPASNLIWADRDSIGYKLIGRLPLRRGGSPDLPKPGWTGEFEWEGTIPYEELPEVVDPESGFLVTANNRIVGDSYPHHITSEWFDGFRAARIEELLLAEDEHDLESFEAMQSDLLSSLGLEVARRLGRLQPPGQRERSALERLRSWDGRLDVDSVAASIYQAFVLRLAREFARAVIGDRDIAERWLSRADNGFISHVASPWRWHAHLMALWEEADDELIGRPWEDLVLESLAGALDDLGDRFGPDPEAWRWGRVHEMEFPHPLGEANPLLRRLLNRRLEVGGAQETVSQVAYDPNDPYRAVWAPSWRMVADPADPGRSRWQAFTGQSGHPASRHYDDLQEPWAAGRTQPMAGEGPWRELRLLPG